MKAPERGDLIKLDFDHTAGHEQAGYRRAIVVSPFAYNKASQLAIVCAITNQKKGYPFEVPIPEGLKVAGVILSDQVRTIDWAAWQVLIVDRAPRECIDEVLEKLGNLIG
ncbi:MAG: type II toxin-antitoxin system PemK/MazF family toxin [Anaerolineaceae bacterium]